MFRYKASYADKSVNVYFLANNINFKLSHHQFKWLFFQSVYLATYIKNPVGLNNKIIESLGKIVKIKKADKLTGKIFESFVHIIQRYGKGVCSHILKKIGEASDEMVHVFDPLQYSSELDNNIVMDHNKDTIKVFSRHMGMTKEEMLKKISKMPQKKKQEVLDMVYKIKFEDLLSNSADLVQKLDSGATFIVLAKDIYCAMGSSNLIDKVSVAIGGLQIAKFVAPNYFLWGTPLGVGFTIVFMGLFAVKIGYDVANNNNDVIKSFFTFSTMLPFESPYYIISVGIGDLYYKGIDLYEFSQNGCENSLDYQKGFQEELEDNSIIGDNNNFHDEV